VLPISLRASCCRLRVVVLFSLAPPPAATMAPCINEGRGIVYRCPKAGKVASDIATIHETEAKAEIAQLLEDPNPDHAWLGGPAEQALLRQGCGREQAWWPETYMHLHQIPKYWLVEFLSKFGLPNLPTDSARAVDLLDLKCSLGNLIEFATELKPPVKLPRQCLNKLVLELTWSKTLIRMCRLSESFVQQANSSDGLVNYIDFGFYRFAGVADSSGITAKTDRVTNLNGTMACGEYIVFKKDIVITSNFSDERAGVYKGMLNLSVASHMKKAFALDPILFGEKKAFFLQQATLAIAELQQQTAPDGDAEVDARPADAGRRKRAGPPPCESAARRRVNVL
jgi:hypothetical protein